ncbi:3-phytase [Macrophomina phaseolina]|uniref:3-phytase n=1 Tax=Macrophomina phaseolina TaxID=35725 RepID=A0ABQ8FVM9_9PEZI|nr:3-phytase [Macrophomina phaseolina]
MLTRSLLAALPLLSSASAVPSIPSSASAAVNTTTCNGNTYTYKYLAGYGLVPGNASDKYGDTLGGLGSSIAIENGSWKRSANGTYTGTLWALPDRGWNTNGTLNYNPRVHKLGVSFTPAKSSASPNLRLAYLDTVLFSDPSGTPVTGLDGDFSGHISFDGFPDLPVATYVGDGFGGNGTGGRRVSVDSEGLVLGPDGSFWVSDEYGPYIYRFSKGGKMVSAIRPPDAFIPIRNETESFSASSAPLYDPERVPIPEDPTSGRANNQGFEGLTISPDGTTLSVLAQSALMQDGGAKSSTRRHARLLQYDITNASHPVYKKSYVVSLPTFTNADDKTRVAAQSEILALSPTQFLVLARDSNAGRAAESTLSLYRHVDVFDIANATDVTSSVPGVDAVNASVASTAGVLKSGVAPATFCAWLDFNVNTQLGRFGLHNGGEDDAGLLNEKWEALAVVPVIGDDGAEVEGEWFLISLSDDDFITQDGYMDGGRFRYADETGASLDNQALVFRVGLEKGLRPAGY